MAKRVNKEESNYNKRAIPIKSIADAKRLLARIIWLYQKGKVEADYAKNIAYLAKSYAELTKIEKLEEIEARITELESRTNGN